MTDTRVFRIQAPSSERDVLVAELHSLGTLGLEETDDGIVAYFEGDESSADVRGLADASHGIRITGPETVPATDWEREWRRGLEPRRIGPLWIRPSWCESRGQPELVIDPRQAFGSGAHASTRLALVLLLRVLRPGDRVLDVGTGSGILALAARRQGSGPTLGIDLDPAACRNARDNAIHNGLEGSVACATLDAIAPRARFEIVVANMLLSGLEPWLARIGRHAARALVISGQLEVERSGLRQGLQALGWRLHDEASEEQSGDVWCAGVWLHTASLQ